VRDPNRDAVQKRLEALGFVVDLIAEHGSERRPDLMALADAQMLYVEVKTRTEDAALRAKMESVPAGRTAGRQDGRSAD
jgi:Holliday junction resolvase